METVRREEGEVGRLAPLLPPHALVQVHLLEALDLAGESGVRGQGQGSGVRSQGSRVRGQGSGVRGQGSGVRGQGSGARGQGSG